MLVVNWWFHTSIIHSTLISWHSIIRKSFYFSLIYVYINLDQHRFMDSYFIQSHLIGSNLLSFLWWSHGPPCSSFSNVCFSWGFTLLCLLISSPVTSPSFSSTTLLVFRTYPPIPTSPCLGAEIVFLLYPSDGMKSLTFLFYHSFFSHFLGCTPNCNCHSGHFWRWVLLLI